MALTNVQVEELAKRMNIPLERCCFKSELEEEPLKYNRSYIINLEDEFDKNGERNDGSHYTCFQVNKYANGKVEPIYFDSYGVALPLKVLKFVDKSHIPYNTKDIQSLMNSACGWYCLAFLHYINTYTNRTQSIYDDCEHFTELFNDLTETNDFKYNEWVLKLFFQSSDENTRRKNPVTPFKEGELKFIADPNTISTTTEKGIPF